MTLTGSEQARQRVERSSMTAQHGTARIPRDQLPPGPRLPYLVQTVLFMRFRHRFVPAMHKRYGDMFSLRIAPDSRTVVVVNRPEHIKEVFAGDPHGFHAGKGNAILGPVMGEHSVLLTDEDVHLRARKLLMPAFNGSSLRGYRSLVTELAGAEADRWTPGTPFGSLARMNALTLEIILRVVFGVSDEQRLAKLRPLVNATIDIGPVILLGWIYPKLQNHRPWKAYLRAQEQLDELLYAEIAERRAASDLAERTDVLSRLLHVGESEDGADALSDVELRDQLVTLLLAGHETTATALAWALHEIGSDQRLLARCVAAADSGGDDFLGAVLKESMRVHPVIPMVARYLMQPATIGGIDIPAGVTVAPSIILAHSRAENFPDPAEFRPERFLGGPVPPNTWIPFGGGVRRCIGAGFSLMEGVAVLGEVLRRYTVRVPEGTTEYPKVRNITSVPGHGSKIIATAR